METRRGKENFESKLLPAKANIYIPSHKEQPPTLVNDLILAPENSRYMTKTKGKARQKKIEE